MFLKRLRAKHRIWWEHRMAEIHFKSMMRWEKRRKNKSLLVLRHILFYVALLCLPQLFLIDFSESTMLKKDLVKIILFAFQGIILGYFDARRTFKNKESEYKNFRQLVNNQ